jgi:NADH:ubiquinone reductase (H+-translocating)
MSEIPIISESKSRPVIAIVGAGFGGLAAAKGLRKQNAKIVLIDRTNHHLFQPLLYQVATATLAPADIAAPIRQVLAKNKNTEVILAEVRGIDRDRRQLLLDVAGHGEETLKYDYLVVATGVRHSYFGHEEFAKNAPGLKALTDATSIRARILKSFEMAESEPDPSRRRQLLTFVLVGAGPTGVEMAGAIAELRRFTLRREFRRIDPNYARIILVEAGPRVLATFAPDLSSKAERRLGQLGVEVMTNARVENVDETGVIVGGRKIESRTVIWTAGVEPSPAAGWLGATPDRAGRVKVQPDCSIPGHPEIFVVGDTANFEEDGKPLPGVAQVAMQQGRYVAKVIRARLEGRTPPGPFRYFDIGSMAVIGRGFAVLEIGKIRWSGYLAWLIWATIHLAYLAQFGNRLRVLTQWAWTYFTRQSGSRLIVEPLTETPHAKSSSA